MCGRFFVNILRDLVHRHDRQTYRIEFFLDTSALFILFLQFLEALFQIAVAGISLLVGGIGIMNIMYVSVTERTREIGLRMSIGAKGRDILAQFLIESILISVTGGLIGVVFGIGAAVVVNLAAAFPIYIQPWSVLLSFAVCTLTGVFFGWYPAQKAAMLDPIEAIRYE